jgi:excisionase family DNA binding protein
VNWTLIEGTSVVPLVLTLPEAAKYLRVSKSHLSNVINGKVRGIEPLRFRRVGRRILFRRRWLDEWMELADVEAIR